MQTHTVGAVSSNPALVTMKNTIGEEGNRKSPRKSISIEKTLKVLFLVSAKLEIEYATQKKTAGDHLIKSPSLEKFRALSLVSACRARNRVCDAVVSDGRILLYSSH